MRFWRSGAVKGDNVRPAQHFVQILNVSRAEHALYRAGQRFTIVVVDLQPESAGPMCDSLPYPAHSDDAEYFPAKLASQQSGRCPAGPFLLPDQRSPLADTSRHSDNHRHSQIGRIVGKNAGSVGDHNPALRRSGQIDMIRAGTETGNQLQPVTGRFDQGSVDCVSNRRDQNVTIRYRSL